MGVPLRITLTLRGPGRGGQTIITSNKSISQWPDMLAGDEILATAILDRLLHHCHVVNIDGRSFRLRELEAQAAKR